MRGPRFFLGGDARPVGPFSRKLVYLPRSCRRARSVPPTQPTPSHATISYGPSLSPAEGGHAVCLADPIESPAERESGLLIPRRRGPLRFTGPVQNHVELGGAEPSSRRIMRNRLPSVEGWEFEKR